MRYSHAFSAACVAVALSTPALSAQGGMMGRGGMMGGGDSTTSAVMRVVHELMTNHDKLRRTVVNLPNGIRTITESDDPVMAAQIKSHVATTGAFVEKGHDPNLPMSTPSLHGVLRNGTKIVRRTEVTEKGVIVIETSDDVATVALMQAHAAEVTDLVKRGMAAMHETMSAPPAPVAAPSAAPEGAPAQMSHAHSPGMSHDSAMASSEARPTRAGQEGFATIGEIVRLLDADPRTDWSKVDIDALREHLRDMDDVTMRATVRMTSVQGGATFDVSGAGRVRDAVRRMAMAHGATIVESDGFSWSAVETPTGARVTVKALVAANAT
ncbi:MAG: hypothetical protein IT353_06415, partial [Gemmatimonadaceae bacterium]|nr:hypothetical protein [Gemmatimonadaceae bacterium]